MRGHSFGLAKPSAAAPQHRRSERPLPSRNGGVTCLGGAATASPLACVLCRRIGRHALRSADHLRSGQLPWPRAHGRSRRVGTCPVLVVQDRRPACATDRGPVAVLVSALDQVDSLLDTAFREAAQRRSRLVVLYQWDPPAGQPRRVAETEQQKLLDSWLSDRRDPDEIVAVTAEIIPCGNVTRIADFLSGAVLLITSAGNAALLRVATAVPAILFVPTAAH